MAALIDREALLCALDKQMGPDTLLPPSAIYTIIAIKRTVRDMPAVDAAPVRHGRWQFPLLKPYNKDAKRCSECHQTQSYGLLKYCPNCGAKMDGGMQVEKEK